MCSLVGIVSPKFADMCCWSCCVSAGNTRQTLLAGWNSWSASYFALHKVVFMSKVY